MIAKIYKCLVVDDEPIARQIVVSYIQHFQNLELFSECKNAIEALEYLQKNPEVDIIFLDINMPTFSGISLVKILINSPQIIFTTAYHEYAIESYELDVVDYLLKPFSLDRFEKAVSKAILRIGNEVHFENNPLQVKADGKIYFIDIEDIMFCESMRNYTRIFLKDSRKLMPLLSLSKFEIELNRFSSNFYKSTSLFYHFQKVY